MATSEPKTTTFHTTFPSWVLPNSFLDVNHSVMMDGVQYGYMMAHLISLFYSFIENGTLLITQFQYNSSWEPWKSPIETNVSFGYILFINN
jgi:hypothetical protein